MEMETQMIIIQIIKETAIRKKITINIMTREKVMVATLTIIITIEIPTLM